jgi:hypothetical protein
MTTIAWTSTAPEIPGHYWVRKTVRPGVKQLRVAEFIGDDEIWLAGLATAASEDDLREWEWWPVAIEPPPK